MYPSNLPDYLCGIVKVPLSNLQPEDNFPDVIPSTLWTNVNAPLIQDFLSNPAQSIYGIINEDQLQQLHKDIKPLKLQDSLQRRSRSPRINLEISCLISRDTINKAKITLSPDFECTVKLYCIPAGRNDGEIFRMVRRLMDAKEYDQADGWLSKLKGRKHFHLRCILERPSLLHVMDSTIPFSGLWDDFTLGNWAKHFAAHCDHLIINYWRHIHKTWSAIFDGVESSPNLLDIDTVRALQNRMPSLSSSDSQFIRRSMNNTLFPRITSESCRDKLLANILQLDVLIPSILTFDKNMQFISLGAKILQKYIQDKPKKVTKTVSVHKKRPNLLEVLSKSWNSNNPVVEWEEGEFWAIEGPSPCSAAFLSLFLAALRYFPKLSARRPLEDLKGQPMDAFPTAENVSWLKKQARTLGFLTDKVRDCDELQKRPVLERSNIEREFWQGGFPSISQYCHLQESLFLSSLGHRRHGDTVSQKSFIRQFIDAFFNPATYNMPGQHPARVLCFNPSESRFDPSNFAEVAQMFQHPNVPLQHQSVETVQQEPSGITRTTEFAVTSSGLAEYPQLSQMTQIPEDSMFAQALAAVSPVSAGDDPESIGQQDQQHTTKRVRIQKDIGGALRVRRPYVGVQDPSSSSAKLFKTDRKRTSTAFESTLETVNIRDPDVRMHDQSSTQLEPTRQVSTAITIPEVRARESTHTTTTPSPSQIVHEGMGRDSTSGTQTIQTSGPSISPLVPGVASSNDPSTDDISATAPDSTSSSNQDQRTQPMEDSQAIQNTEQVADPVVSIPDSTETLPVAQGSIITHSTNDEIPDLQTKSVINFPIEDNDDLPD